MAKPRTTVDVIPLLTWTNAQLKRTDDDATKDFKAGICVMIERVLLNANRYNGFFFLNPVGS